MIKQGLPGAARCVAAFFMGLALPLSAGAAEATVPAAAGMLAAPNAAAAVVAELPANAKVETLAKQGFWQQVRFGDKEGWVKLTSIRLVNQSSITLSGLAAVGTGRAGSGSVVSTSGTRGLQQQDLLEAQPDYEAMDKIAAAEAPTGDEVREFSRAAGLKSRQVSYVVKQ